MKSVETTICSVKELLEYLSENWKGIDRHQHIRLWYRGQSDEEWSLTPAVYRDSFNVKDESDRLEKEQQLTQDFKVHSASLLPPNTKEEDLYFLQQHYKMPTRLLDWSYTPLTALYFAVNEMPDKNGALFLMDAYQLAHSQKAYDLPEGGFKGAPTSTFPLFRKALETISHWKKYDTFPDHIFPIRPYFTDRRIILQKGCFTFHVPKKNTLTTEYNSTLKKLVIPSEKKSSIKKELALLGINDFYTYGDMESLSRTLKSNHGVKE